MINTVKVLPPQQVMLEVRFVEASRRPAASSACSGTCSAAGAANIGIAAAGGQSAGQSAPARRNVGRSAQCAAGVLSGASPFGFMIGRMIAGGVADRRA